MSDNSEDEEKSQPEDVEPEEPEEKSDESEEEEQRDPREERATVEKVIKDGLSDISKTADNDGYAFSKLSISEKEIRSLFRYLRNYPHLRYIDFSQNAIRDISILSNIPYLLTLNASQNKIEKIDLFAEDGMFTYLQKVNLKTNRIRELIPIQMPRLRHLNL